MTNSEKYVINQVDRLARGDTNAEFGRVFAQGVWRLFFVGLTCNRIRKQMKKGRIAQIFLEEGVCPF